MKQRISELIGGDSSGRLWTWWRIAGLVFMGVVTVAFVVSAACTQTGTTQPPTATTVAPQPAAGSGASPSSAVDTAAVVAKYGAARAVVVTNKGTFTIKLFAADAPATVANFAKLANSKFYDGLKWHRYVPKFIVQGGDPYTKTGAGPIGTGGPGWTIPGEFSAHKHVLGSVAMARTQGDPNSAGSQFYVALRPLPRLDGQYAVFGQVTSGIDVVKKLRAPGDDAGQVTLAMLKNADRIVSIRVVGAAK